mmetsp:Transcript_11668/g.13719  ORF Transcript_11668/g.13719 Transcript_11668/m.13719 type:complete len:301 (+) Transcript_11668:202-1104(+)
MMLTIFAIVTLCSLFSVNAFNLSPTASHRHFGLAGGKEHLTITSMAAGNKKKRRRRKKPESAPSLDDRDISASDATVDVPSVDPDNTRSAAIFNPLQDGLVSGNGNQDDFRTVESGGVLPDIRNVLKKKEQKKLDIEAEELQTKNKRPKISRKDKAAFLQLLEAEPFADADDSFFEAEEYGTVSALLGEGALDFLGIPPGPLQIGHFIGALGIVLCAFVEYPGFPLTNLPTPLRGSLQGGLATIYVINAALAGVAYFKAGERGQSGVLWAAKTFSVGGLAYDQLTQLPTLEEVNKQGGKR